MKQIDKVCTYINIWLKLSSHHKYPSTTTTTAAFRHPVFGKIGIYLHCLLYKQMGWFQYIKSTSRAQYIVELWARGNVHRQLAVIVGPEHFCGHHIA